MDNKKIVVATLTGMVIAHAITIPSLATEIKTTKQKFVTTNFEKEFKINIADANLKKALYEELEIDKNKNITNKELARVKTLNLKDRDIKSLEGLQYCTKLTSLDISDNKIEDLSPLAELENLTTLYCSENNIKDISTIATLKDLTYLDLNNNNLTNISGIENLTGLDFLHLAGNNIVSIDSLANLKSVERIDLSDNKISDIKALGEMKSLKEIEINDNRIEDISPLYNLKKLETVMIMNNRISNINSLNHPSLDNVEMDATEQEVLVPAVLTKNGIAVCPNPIENKVNGTVIKPSNITNDGKFDEKKNAFIWNEITENTGNSYVFEYYNNNKSYNIKVVQPIALTSDLKDINDHWAKDSIIKLVNQGYMNGYDDGTFRPSKTITRAEFIKVINNIFNFRDEVDIDFKDVSEDDWYYKDICAAIQVGYVKGYEDNTFRPNDNITRQEVAVIISNILNIEDEKTDKVYAYKDGKEVAKWALKAMEGMLEKGYMNGYNDGTLKPKENLTRAEAVSILVKLD